jgi:hypothetical protein
MGFPFTYHGAIGTSVIKVFDQTGAATGYSEALCAKKGRAYQSVMIERNQHAGYYPGASLLTLKVIFDPKEGTLLGAQAIGHDGAEKRIDVIATAIAGGFKSPRSDGFGTQLRSALWFGQRPGQYRGLCGRAIFLTGRLSSDSACGSGEGN